MKASVIGSGFSGLAAASYLGKEGIDVEIYEKNDDIGGRARSFKTQNGYTFDMGPSWYWMPEIFENFFNNFGFSQSDFYKLKLLDPSFRMIFKDDFVIDVPSDYEKLCELFESLETGSAGKLKKFMNEAEYKYNLGMNKLAQKPGNSLFEYFDFRFLKGLASMDVFSSFSSHIRKYFSHPAIISILEFPVLFLGAMPSKTPALYSLMNYAGLKLGTWYPEGGFGNVINAFKKVTEKYSIPINLSSPVSSIIVNKNKARAVRVNGVDVNTDAIIASADYHHVESKLLEYEFRNYSESYWDKKTFAPSCLIYYVGITKKIKNLNHHNLFFQNDLNLHAEEIYDSPKWPTQPLFYLCCPSKSDKTIAPEGHENLFLLMPIAPGLEDDTKIREKYFDIMMDRIEKFTSEKIRQFIDYKKSYCISDFISDYNAYKGNAYGLANTLRQTAVLKPKIRSKKINNLFFTGQLTVPGPGVPPAILSGKIAANELIKSFR
ncbi:MAG TPA: phytoene desaturase family protein [Ignavibacteria bacterium]|nr:phytoene desaturase family protein [Ignavibacteria bacterium]